MLSKFVKLACRQNFHGLAPVTSKSFGGGSKKKTDVVGHDKVTHATTKTDTDLDVEVTYKHGPSLAKTDLDEIPKIIDVAHLNYRRYPNVPHNDPNSAEYIHSERDERADSARIEAYNHVIRRLKSDLQMQADVYEIIENLDRPYKREVPGVGRNITGGFNDYFPPEDIGFKRLHEREDEEFFNKHYNNADRWVNDAIFHPKFAPIQSDLEWQKEYEARPVNDHYHPDKGYKYDVETPWEQRYPHVADRMGYPEILGTPFERLLRLEGDIYHPTYLDQPFVQIPNSDPHESLNFEEGEVVYENTQILEWAKFFNLSTWSVYGFCAFFVPYSLLYKTHMPLSHAYDNLFVPYYTHTMFFFDNWTLHAPIFGTFAAYATYLTVALTHSFWKDYVVKMQYSKDKELLFVTRISPYMSLEEEVFEVQHLEVLPPSVKVGVTDLSSQDEDGLWDVTCLASHRNLVVNNDSKYWNPAQRKDFFDKVMNFWTPDIIEPSRAQQLNDIATGNWIELGKDQQNWNDASKRLENKSQSK